jgi:hypothetical protein
MFQHAEAAENAQEHVPVEATNAEKVRNAPATLKFALQISTFSSITTSFISFSTVAVLDSLRATNSAAVWTPNKIRFSNSSSNFYDRKMPKMEPAAYLYPIRLF